MYQQQQQIAAILRAKSNTEGGLNDDDLQALARAEAAMKDIENELYRSYNMTPPQQTIGSMVTTGGPYNLSEEDQSLLNQYLTTE